MIGVDLRPFENPWGLVQCDGLQSEYLVDRVFCCSEFASDLPELLE